MFNEHKYSLYEHQGSRAHVCPRFLSNDGIRDTGGSEGTRKIYSSQFWAGDSAWGFVDGLGISIWATDQHAHTHTHQHLGEGSRMKEPWLHSNPYKQ